MKVKATRKGFYDNEIRKEGAVFEVTKEAFSKSWMESLSKPGPKPKVVEPSSAPSQSAI